MDLNKFTHIYFLGAGGIGMSALARYFRILGHEVAGYDRVATSLTVNLENEGIRISYTDDPALIPSGFNLSDTTLVVRTPAVKEDNAIYNHFITNGFTIIKRAEVLGMITAGYMTIAVAGTHGKTTVSTMIAHILRQSVIDCTAFLGGISKNYETNFLFSGKSPFAVAEADEFDRSFLKLHPTISVITSADADHLDIYGNAGEMLNAFSAFAKQISHEGSLIIKKGVRLNTDGLDNVEILTYSIDDVNADFNASNIILLPRNAIFDLVYPGGIITGLELGISGLMNIENALAASAVTLKAGVTETELRSGLITFRGIKRRFDVRFSNENIVYIDDYAHHPEEIKALLKSVKAVYPGKSITGIFQPHLFSRTRDFADGFAESLSLLDEVILLDIYPAREKPIEGVTSSLILDKITTKNKHLFAMGDLPDKLQHIPFEILLTIGAGDIDKLVEPITQMLIQQNKSR